jgi:hypothetical protein
VYALYFDIPTAHFATKAGVSTKSNVKILVSINFVPFLDILFVTFEYYQNLAPDCHVKKPWVGPYMNEHSFTAGLRPEVPFLLFYHSKRSPSTTPFTLYSVNCLLMWMLTEKYMDVIL